MTTLPAIPAKLDDALYNALRGIVGSDLAFPAVEAAWEAIISAADVQILGKNDVPWGRSPGIFIPLEAQDA